MPIFEESQPGRAASAQLTGDGMHAATTHFPARDLDHAYAPEGAGGSKARAA